MQPNNIEKGHTMLANFNFSQTNPAGMGLNVPEGYYRARIASLEDKNDGGASRCRIAFQIDPSEGVNGTVQKTYRYPDGSPDDGALAFWMRLFIETGVYTEEQLRSQPIQLDPKQYLQGRNCCIYFKPNARKYTDRNGKERTAYDIQVISQKDYAEGKAAGTGNVGAGNVSTLPPQGQPGAVMPQGQSFQPTQQPATQQPAMQQPAMQQPAMQQPAMQQPVPNNGGGVPQQPVAQPVGGVQNSFSALSQQQ